MPERRTLKKVHGGGYDVVCICETWLNDSIPDSEILPGYNIFRKDRANKIGGGVLVGIKSDLEASHRPDLERPNCELVVIQLKQTNSKPVTLYTFYRPPNAAPDALHELNDSLQSKSENDGVVVVRDFNLPGVTWSEDHTPPMSSRGHMENERFCELFNDNFLQQHITGSTHLGGNKLDLLLCNQPELIRDIRTLDHCDFPSDHFPVEFSITQTFSRARRIRLNVYDFNHGRFQELRTFLQRTPIEIDLTENIDECWMQWKSNFQAAVDQFVPVKTITNKNSPPWIDCEVRYLIRKKYTALRNYRLDKSDSWKLKLRTISQNVKKLIRRKHREYLHKIQSSTENDDYDDTPPKTHVELSNITVSVEEVVNNLSNLDVTKAHGPDGIHPRLLKECSEQIGQSLCALFNHSPNCGRVPIEWKAANITPVHKKESKEVAENFRPISLLSIVSKILERSVCSNLYNHISHLIADEQHGFIRNRSCVSQLLPVFHAIGKSLDKNIQTDILYLDFAKAFDSVDHDILLAKLKSYG
ncbi:Hypothetical predicted protein [Paramuricea clavata]|uniref:Uncharacterized protein n=1 Tax=Paramuricea clavata TaxID=317549 RepID=A0A7D9E8W5_PARCT|nr:Hypothetical predicted protein [Paramuricea clavata]